MWKQYRLNIWISIVFPTLCWLYFMSLVLAAPIFEEKAYRDLDRSNWYFQKSFGKSESELNDLELEYFLTLQRAFAEENHLINLIPYPWKYTSGSMDSYLDRAYWQDNKGINSLELSPYLFYWICLCISQYRIRKIKKILLKSPTYRDVFEAKTKSLKKYFMLPFIQEISLYFWIFKDVLTAKLKNIDEALTAGVINEEEAEKKKAELISLTKRTEAEHYFNRWYELKKLKLALSRNVISQDEYNTKYLELKVSFMSSRV